MGAGSKESDPRKREEYKWIYVGADAVVLMINVQNRNGTRHTFTGDVPKHSIRGHVFNKIIEASICVANVLEVCIIIAMQPCFHI